MPLNSIEANTLLIERILGKPQSIKGPEADEYIKKIDVEIAEMRAKGIPIRIPSD